MKKYPAILFLLASLLTLKRTMAQSLSINTDGSTANASSILDVHSTTKGVVVRRMTKDQKNAIAAPAQGLIILQTAPDSTGFQFYDGSNWVWLSPVNGVDAVVWKTAGNSGTDTAT